MCFTNTSGIYKKNRKNRKNYNFYIKSIHCFVLEFIGKTICIVYIKNTKNTVQ